MENFDLKYFLAANSCEGFISAFNECYSARKGWRAYIIKGGPGTGKSSFMKFLAAKAADKKMKIELCPCSSDPDSLDAVIFPEIKTVVLDGTAPHTLDPKYPAVCEEILNFGEYWRNELFENKADEIITLTDKNKSFHRTASRYLSAAGELIKDNFKLAQNATDAKKTVKFATGLCKKYIPQKSAKGEEQTRYLCGTTPKGVVSFAKTALLTTNTQIIIEDRCGSISDLVMKKVREYALANGHNIITVKNCFLPNAIIDHIIIPELSIAFLREYEFQHFDTSVRRIHARRFLNTKKLSGYRERMNFNKKVMRQLLVSSAQTLRDAKTTHDELEAYYVSAMDFGALAEFATKFAQKLFE